PLSVAPISSRASRMWPNVFHLLTKAPSGMAFAVTWLEIMPSVIGRRPKGVVVICVCIVLHLSLGKRSPPAKTTRFTCRFDLDTDSRKWDSPGRQTLREGLPEFRFSGLFLLRISLHPASLQCLG